MTLFGREDIAGFSREILKILDVVESEDDLMKISERQFPAKRGFIDSSLRPSEEGTLSYKISYVINGRGIPLELLVNDNLDYSKIILKNRDRILGYSEFFKDVFGNIVQLRNIDTSKIPTLKKELEKLCVY